MVKDVEEEWSGVAHGLDVLIVLQAEMFNQLALGEHALAEAALWKEDRAGIRHVTLAHQVRHEADRNSEGMPVVDRCHIKVRSILLHFELFVEARPQLRLEPVEHASLLHLLE